MAIERFLNTPDLFGCGVGSGTRGDIECELCGEKYNQGEDKRDVCDGDYVSWTSFAGKQVCMCCFARIEEEIWRRREDVITYIALRLKVDRNIREGLLKGCKEAVEAVSPGNSVKFSHPSTLKVLKPDQLTEGDGHTNP